MQGYIHEVVVISYAAYWMEVLTANSFKSIEVNHC